jgi:hypothetical protein
VMGFSNGLPGTNTRQKSTRPRISRAFWFNLDPKRYQILSTM